MHSFFANTKQQTWPNKEKIRGKKFNKPLFVLKLNIYEKENDHKLLSNKIFKIFCS